MLSNSTIQHLRFGFSLFLMPVYWFALSQAASINLVNAVILFVVLHFLVYPSSNGYNSYMDRDTGSIGGIEKPLPVQKELFYTSVGMDVLAVGVSMFISLAVAVGVLIYITASRLYSYRGVRLKKYPIAGYLTVVLCQGALVYYLVSISVDEHVSIGHMLLPAIVSSLLIGGTYPLTQVYQHQQDKEDGITTLSYLLGIKGTFVYCFAVLFVALLLLVIYFMNTGQLFSLLIYGIAMLPVGVYLTRWFVNVNKNALNADFKSLMKMNYIASLCSNAAFIGMLIVKMVNR